MKKIIQIVSAALLISASACAQKSTEKAPTAVKMAFEQKFNDSKKVNWDMEDATSWEAEFKMNGMKYSANFTTQGEWQETEHEIKNSEIPGTVQQMLAKDFDGYKIGEAEISETANGKVYEIAVEKGEQEWELVFDESGKLIEKKAIDQEDED
jgi:uncharacterized protein YxeA